jgi:16S rRNA processing protein RimM
VNAPAAPAEGALPDDAVEVGRVIGAWGVKGGFKVKPFSGDPQALFSSKRWYVRPPEVAPGPKPAQAAGTLPTLLRIASAREQGDTVVATAHDIDDRDAAEALKGARLFVSRASFPTPEADEFYWVDLIGLAVVNRDGTALGTVVGLIETGPHCVLRIAPPAADAPAPTADEVLIPFVSAYVDAVDRDAQRITVDWQADY